MGFFACADVEKRAFLKNPAQMIRCRRREENWKFMEIMKNDGQRLRVLCNVQNSLQIIDNDDKLWYITLAQLCDLNNEFAYLNGVFNSPPGCE